MICSACAGWGPSSGSALTAGGARAPEQALTGPGCCRDKTFLTHLGSLGRQDTGPLTASGSDCFLVFSHLQPGFLAPRQRSQFELVVNRLWGPQGHLKVLGTLSQEIKNILSCWHLPQKVLF